MDLRPLCFAALLACLLLGGTALAEAPRGHPPGLLFWSGFEAGVAPVPVSVADCYANGCWQDIAGTDSLTGYAWPLKVLGGTTRFQMILDPGNPRRGAGLIEPSPSIIGDYQSNRIETVLGPSRRPTRALRQRISRTICSGTASQVRCDTARGYHGSSQDAFTILPEREPKDLYVSFWMKWDSAWLARLHQGDSWRQIFEWKSGDPGGVDNGDYRISLAVHAYNGNAPWWSARGDDCAGASRCSSRPFWQYDRRQPTVTPEAWTKIEIFWSRRHDATGRVWMAVNGTPIADHAGPNYGVLGKPINRIFVSLAYTGGSYPIDQWQDDLQIWDRFPPACRAADPRTPWCNPPYAPH